jgi:flagellar assembly protein FliH
MAEASTVPDSPTAPERGWRPTETLRRGPEARDAAPALFNVDLRGRRPERELGEGVRAQARATGYAEGWSQGRMAAQQIAQAVAAQQAASARVADLAREAALQRALGGIARAATNLQRYAAADLASIEDLVLRAAVDIAEALLGRELRAGTGTGREALQRAMSLAPAQGTVTVLLSPADYLAVTGREDGECAQVHGGQPVVLRPDPALTPGDALAQCGSTLVDARLTAAVERVRRALLPC